MSEREQTQSDASGAMVPLADPNKALADWGFQELTGRYFTGVDESTPEGRQTVFRLLNVKGEPIDQYVNKRIDVVNFLLTPAIFADEETGEEIRTVVTKLLLADGRIIETHSKGVCKSLMLATQKLAHPPFDPPLAATVIQQALRGKKSWMVLDFATASSPAKKVGK